MALPLSLHNPRFASSRGIAKRKYLLLRQRRVYPIGISAPLIWLAASEARKVNVCAMESGRTHLDGSAAGIARLLAGVSIVLGKTAFTVTPEPSSSKDSVRIN